MACYCISKVIEEAETKELIKAFEVKGEDQLAVGLTLFLYTICPIFITDFAGLFSLLFIYLFICLLKYLSITFIIICIYYI